MVPMLLAATQHCCSERGRKQRERMKCAKSKIRETDRDSSVLVSSAAWFGQFDGGEALVEVHLLGSSFSVVAAASVKGGQFIMNDDGYTAHLLAPQSAIQPGSTRSALELWCGFIQLRRQQLRD